MKTVSLKGPYFWSFDPSIALKVLKLELTWVKTVWKKILYTLFWIKCGRPNYTHKTIRKTAKLPPLYIILLQSTHICRPDWRQFYRIFLRQFEELKRTRAGLQMHVWIIFIEVGFNLAAYSKNEFKIAVWQKSVLKFAARPFFLIFRRINRVRILCLITYSKIDLQTSFKCQKIPQFMNYF